MTARQQDQSSPSLGAAAGVEERLRHTEQRLREVEERYALAASAAAEGIYEWNVDTGALLLTEKAKAFFSLPDQELTSQAWNMRVHPDDMAGYCNALVDHFKGRTQHLQHEYRIAATDGGYRWVLDRGIGVRDARDHVTRLVGAISDITQRKEAELELRRARDQAQAALQHQTATAEILRVMASSPADVQPVFDAIVRSGIRLFEGAGVTVTQPENGQVRLMAIAERDAERAERWKERFPFPLTREYMHGVAILDCRMVDMPDVERMDDRFAAGKRNFAASGYRAMTIVPMVKDGAAIGTIAVVRDAPGPLSEKQIELLQTFADQAVIAIENVRLFNEIRESLEQQRAASEILQVISGSIADTGPVFEKILESCERLFSGRIVGLNLVGPDGLIRIGAYHGEGRAELEHVFPLSVTPSSGSGRAIVERRVIHYPDVEHGPDVPAPTRQGCKAIGIKSALFAPLLWEGRGVGVIFVGRDYLSSFSERDIALVKIFADQAAIAIENVRLFNEIQHKSRQLEIANQHKSQFLANMSHELRTPLNAIIGFTRIVMRRSQEQLEPKQYENLEKILASGQNLLALINAILDLAKVEAGRVEVTPGEIDPSRVLEQCIRTVEPLVKEDDVRLVSAIDGALPPMYVDEEKMRQIVVNLLSNAAKFTARGSIELRARAFDGYAEIAVVDTGIGIAVDKLELVFHEFEQADATSTRVHGGTGLGLTIARRLARLMGGDIRAESTPGVGSAFTLTLPVRYRPDGT
jgi:PAS domain S-box-containing protein